MQRTKHIGSIAVLGALVFAGCATSSRDEPPSTRELLGHGVDVPLRASAVSLDFTVRVKHGDVWAETPVSLPLRTGHMALSADTDGTLVVDDIELVLEELMAESESPQVSLEFSDVAGKLVRAAVFDATEWNPADDVVSGDAQLSLKLSWALNVDDMVYPLRSEYLPAMAWHTNGYRRDDDLVVQASGTIDGVFWQWAGLIEFSDLRLSASGTAPHVLD